MKKIYEVYVCKYKGEIVYIGKGLIGRHKHCISGTSHVLELNRLYFSEDADLVEVSVVQHFNKDAEALAFEKGLILKHQPRFNDVHLVNSRNHNTKESLVIKRRFKELGIKHVEQTVLNFITNL